MRDLQVAFWDDENADIQIVREQANRGRPRFMLWRVSVLVGTVRSLMWLRDAIRRRL